MLLALLVWSTVRDEGAMATGKSGRDSTPLPLREVFGYLLRPRTVLYTCVGAGLQLLVVSSVWAWMPSYLNRYYGLAVPAEVLTAANVARGCTYRRSSRC